MIDSWSQTKYRLICTLTLQYSYVSILWEDKFHEVQNWAPPEIKAINLGSYKPVHYVGEKPTQKLILQYIAALCGQTWVV